MDRAGRAAWSRWSRTSSPRRSWPAAPAPARPVRYAHRQPVRGSYAARTMRWGGVIILLFIVCHILDLTDRAR